MTIRNQNKANPFIQFLALFCLGIFSSACQHRLPGDSANQPIRGFPETSASAITAPPASMVGIDTHSHVFGTGADPEMITLGPQNGGQPGWEPYPGKTSMEFELEHGAAVLAPMDMVLISFNNRSAEVRLRTDQPPMAPFDDLELCFQSISSDWPGMVICTYHLYSSPLLRGHNQNPDCAAVEEWGSSVQAEGRQFYEFEDVVVSKRSAAACEALIGMEVQRGEIIGYAGSVADHSMAPFRFKVPHATENPLVARGEKHLHWVQPGSFFYWKCFSTEVEFPPGVLAYPFECGGYQLSAGQRNPAFKYADRD
jgi:hypothetical protein